MPTTKKVKGRPRATFYGCGIYARERLAEQKRMQSEAEADARADGVATYSEVWARPDNDVSKKHLRKGRCFLRSDNLCPRLARQKSMRD